MAPYLVRRGVEDYGATEDEILVAISPDYTEDQAFPILGSHHATSQGDSAISGAQLDTRDLSAWPVLTGNRDELQLKREPTAAAIDRSVPWELAEWTGAPDSPHGWRIRAVSGLRLLSTETDELTGFYNDIVDVDQVVPFLIGSDYAGAGRTDGDRKVTLKVDATKRLRVQREASASALIVYFAIVEFGSAWTVENNIEHTFTAAGAVETETVAAVDWSKTLIEGRLRGPGNGLDESGAVIFRGATSTTVKQKLRSGATLPALYSTVVHLASHPGLNVEHLDSVDGGETDHASGATSVAVTVSSVVEARTMLLGSNTCAGAGTAYPRQYWGFTLASSTSVTWQRSRSGQVSEWALQVIELPEVVDVTPAAAVLELPGVSPSLTRDLAPSPAVLELASPSSSIELRLAPSPAVLELASPSSSIELRLAPSPAILDLPGVSPSLTRDLVPPPAVLELAAPLAVVTLPVASARTGVLRLVAADPLVVRSLAPAPAVLELRSPVPSLRRRLLASPALLELAAPPALAAFSAAIAASPARISLIAPRALLDFSGACKLQQTPQIATVVAAALPLNGFAAPLGSAELVAVPLVLAGFAAALPSSSVVSVSLILCP